MADARAINGASEGLRRILQDNLSLVSILPSQIFIESIDLLPDPIPRPRVTIFLYNITENPFLKNRPDQVVATSAGTATVEPPPCVLDLDYMICAWASNTTDEHMLLGDIVRVFYDHSELDATSLGAGWRPSEAIQISLDCPKLEDQARIWTTFGFKRFKLSLYYKVRIVPIESERTFTSGVVRERRGAPEPFMPPPSGEVPPSIPLP